MLRSALELTTQHISAEYSAESIMEKQENIADKGFKPYFYTLKGVRIMYRTIKIVMANSDEIKWTADQWDDYKYDGKYFIITKGGVWVGFYNLDKVISIIIQ